MIRSTDRLLLDTHAFLWFSTTDSRLRPDVRDLIADAPMVFVSIASAWELAIKTASGKLRLDVSFRRAVELNDCLTLPIALDHVELVATLPRHHGDPFDRMLAAQTLYEGLTLVTHDRAFAPYALPVRWT